MTAAGVAERVVTLYRSAQYSEIAGIVILVYDYLLTLGDEIELIWTSNWSLGKVLFLSVRYCGILSAPISAYYLFSTHPPLTGCDRLLGAFSGLLAVGVVGAEAILVMRTYALSGNNRVILFLLIAIHLAVSSINITVIAKFVGSIHHDTPPYPLMSGCYYTPEHDRIVHYGIAAILTEELVIMLLTIWLGLTRFQHSKDHLVLVLYRDSVVFFLGLFCISLATLVFPLVKMPEVLGLVMANQPIFHVVFSCRIMLHVRSTTRRNEVVSTHPELSDMRFGDDHDGNQRSV